MGIEKTIFGQNAFSKSCFPWSMLPEKPRHTSGFHKKVFMKRPTGHGYSLADDVLFFPPCDEEKTKLCIRLHEPDPAQKDENLIVL